MPSQIRHKQSSFHSGSLSEGIITHPDNGINNLLHIIQTSKDPVERARAILHTHDHVGNKELANALRELVKREKDPEFGYRLSHAMVRIACF